MNIVQDNQELRNIIVAQNKIMLEHTQAFHQHITDLIPKLGKSVTNNNTNTTINNTHHTHNNNNNFSLNIFLNEKCKDAWNMSEFIESLHVTLDDLLLTRERGIGESISRMLVHGLSTLDVYKRPIHCTDLKRDIMYVKDNEVWERDEQNVKIRGAIDQLSYKQIVNDTGGMQRPEMRAVVAQSNAWCVVMHIEGPNPLEVSSRELDGDRPAAVAAGLASLVAELSEAGINRVIVDPGLSINYSSDYARYGELQLETIRRLDELRVAGAPVMIPVPRKAQDHRMHTYLALAIEYGADVIRVHDVEAACDLVTLLGRKLGN